MPPGRSRNRRRQDAAQRAEDVREAVVRHGPGVLRVACAVLLSAASLFGAWHLYQWSLASPSFALEHVSFAGLHRAKEAELLKLGAIPPGQNLLALDTDGLTRAMAAHPWVKKLELTRHLPRGLSVRVEEHTPVAMIVLGDLYLINADAEPFKRVQPGDDLDLPLVTGVDRDAFVSGRDGLREQIRSALVVLTVYSKSPAGVQAPISELRLEQGNLTLVTRGTAQEIALGPCDQAPALLEKKLAWLGQVRAELKRRGESADAIRLEDATRPGWVAVKLSAPVSERNGAR